MSTYRTQMGDSPASIARRLGVSTHALIAANPHKPMTNVAGKRTWATLRAGEALRIPDGMLGDDQYATVTSTKLNIRAMPYVTGSVVGGSSQGDIVTVMNWNAAPPDPDAPMGWAQVSSPLGLDANGKPGRTNTVDGYMSKQYLSLQPSAAPALPPSTPIAMPQIPGLPDLPVPAIPAAFQIPGTSPAPLPPPAPPSPASAAQALAAQLASGGCAGCGDNPSPLAQATYNFKKATLSDPNCQGMACGNIYGSTYNTAAMYAYGPGTQQALSKALGTTARAACTDSSGACLGGAQPALPSVPTIPVTPAVFPSLPTGAATTATITATKLNIRSAPNASADVVGGVAQGGTVNVLNWNGAPADPNASMGWAQVLSPSGLDVTGSPGRTTPVTGYMSKQYLQQSSGPLVAPRPPTPTPVQPAPAPTPTPQQVTQTCPPGQIYIPLLGCQPNPLVQPAQPSGPSTPPAQNASITCPPGQVYLGPLLGCQPVPAPLVQPKPSDTPIGPTLQTCPAGQFMNPLTGKCEALPALPKPSDIIPVQPAPPAPAPKPGTQPTVVPPSGGGTAKEGLSTGAMVGLGLGAAAIVGVAAYALTHKGGDKGAAHHGHGAPKKKAHKKGKRK
jgi:hypothetical protein